MRSEILFLSPKLTPLDHVRSWDTIVHTVNSEAEFSRKLSDQSLKLGCVIIGYSYVTQELIRVIKIVRLKKPLLPTFAHTFGESNIDPGAVMKLSLTGLLRQDSDLATVESMLSQSRLNFQEIQRDTGNDDVIEKESRKNDEAFFSIYLRDLLLGQRTFFDVYIRLAKDRYVKIINKGDPTDHTQIQSLEKKGVTELYLLREQQNKFLRYCDHITTQLSKSGRSSLKDKTQQVLQFGDQILRAFEEKGVTPDNLSFAKDFLTRGMENLRPLTLQSEDMEKIILQALNDYEHSTAMCILGGIITKSLGYTSLEKINSISLAIMLHDIGLLKLQDHLRVHSSIALVQNEKTLYEEHPKHAVEMLSQTDSIPEIVLQAILYHHERRDRSGYPEKISGSAINFVAEIIGICDEYLAYLETKGDHQQFLKACDNELKLKFSPPLILAFKGIFNKKKRTDAGHKKS